MLYVVKMVVNNPNNCAFIGLSKTFSGCMKCLQRVFPDGVDLERLSWSPTGVLFRNIKNPDVFIHIICLNRPWNNNVGWVVTKRHNENRTEEIYAIFDNEIQVNDFINANVHDPMFEQKEKCQITEVDGFIPFAKIIGDENPELNRIHFTIYKTEVEEI